MLEVLSEVSCLFLCQNIAPTKQVSKLVKSLFFRVTPFTVGSKIDENGCKQKIYTNPGTGCYIQVYILYCLSPFL